MYVLSTPTDSLQLSLAPCARRAPINPAPFSLYEYTCTVHRTVHTIADTHSTHRNTTNIYTFLFYIVFGWLSVDYYLKHFLGDCFVGTKKHSIVWSLGWLSKRCAIIEGLLKLY